MSKVYGEDSEFTDLELRKIVDDYTLLTRRKGLLGPVSDPDKKSDALLAQLVLELRGIKKTLKGK